MHIFALLAVLFIGLKLTSVIYWSWWWVLAPLWGGFAIGVVFFLFACGAMSLLRSR
jgi:hypothetical protein